MISFSLDEDQQLIQATVRKFAAEVVRPAGREWERARAVPEAARRAFHELGLGLLDLPAAVGGAGATALSAVVAHEELAFGDPGAAVALWAPHLAAPAVVELGDPAQASRLLARFADTDGGARLGAVAFSEPLGDPTLGPGPGQRRDDDGFATRAEIVAGGYRLHGEKAFVINGGIADLTIVLARLDGPDEEGAAAFAVEGTPDGLRLLARHEWLGLETVHAARLGFDGLFVPAANRLRGPADGFGAGVARLFDRASLVTAARQVGLARAAYEYALAYTQERRAFGKPVAHFQAIAFTLAEMHMDVESMRWLLWRAACTPGSDGGLDPAAVAAAAVHCNEGAFRVADNAVQLLGGAGFIQDYPVEKWLRDTKALALTAPTDERQRLRIAAHELGHPIDPALPSPTFQPFAT